MANLNQCGKDNPNWISGKSTFECLQCGKEFIDYNRITQKRKFCSTECGYENKRRRTMINCEYCDKRVEVHTYDIERGKGRFCSKKCASLADADNVSKRFKGKPKSYESRKKRSESQLGEKGHNWQGGKKSESMFIRNSFDMNEWRKLVFERDDYICQFCGVRGGKLNAHHILSFKDYPEYRFNVDNGITHCKECHNVISSILNSGDIFQPLPRFNTSNNGMRLSP